jgi:hypothetical protein
VSGDEAEELVKLCVVYQQQEAFRRQGDVGRRTSRRLTARSKNPVVGSTVRILGRVLDVLNRSVHLGEPGVGSAHDGGTLYGECHLPLVLCTHHDRLVLLVRLLVR